MILLMKQLESHGLSDKEKLEENHVYLEYDAFHVFNVIYIVFLRVDRVNQEYGSNKLNPCQSYNFTHSVFI